MDVASLDVVEDAHEATFLRRLHSIRLQLAARTITDKISAYLLSPRFQLPGGAVQRSMLLAGT